MSRQWLNVYRRQGDYQCHLCLSQSTDCNPFQMSVKCICRRRPGVDCFCRRTQCRPSTRKPGDIPCLMPALSVGAAHIAATLVSASSTRAAQSGKQQWCYTGRMACRGCKKGILSFFFSPWSFSFLSTSLSVALLTEAIVICSSLKATLQPEQKWEKQVASLRVNSVIYFMVFLTDFQNDCR